MARRALIPPPTAYDERSASRSLESIGSDATGSARAGHGCQTGSKAFRSAGKTPFPGREAGVGLAPPAGCCVREVQLVKPRGEMRKMSPALAVKTLSYSRTCADCGCVACLCGDAVERGCGAWHGGQAASGGACNCGCLPSRPHLPCSWQANGRTFARGLRFRGIPQRPLSSPRCRAGRPSIVGRQWRPDGRSCPAHPACAGRGRRLRRETPCSAA